MSRDPDVPRRMRRTPVPAQLMYIEDLSSGPGTSARIGRVTFSRTAKTARYQGRLLRLLEGQGFKANYYEASTGRHFLIVDPGRAERGGSRRPVEVDEDCREEYGALLRGRHAAR